MAFDSFVIFGAMRTGSNLLEARLVGWQGLACHGEVFNPHFIGGPARKQLFGVTPAMRDADPLALLARMKEKSDGIPGFRFFDGHDTRVRDHCLADPACAKVILTRNPLDSHISLLIARETGQWRLTDVSKRRAARVRFDPRRFEDYLAETEAFYLHLQRMVQTTGQTAFHIGYDDIADDAVIAGLAQFLGSPGKGEGKPAVAPLRQNPEPLADKVENPEEMTGALAAFDRFDLSRVPNLEPRRGPALPGWRAGVSVPILWQPIAGGADLSGWLAALDGRPTGELPPPFNRRTLRDWLAGHPGHRTLAVVRHPVARALAAFRALPGNGPEGLLRDGYGIAVPAGDAAPAEWREAFLGFLAFLRANLSGQTGLRTDPHWASQVALIQGFSQLVPPGLIVREEEMAGPLLALARAFDRAPPVVEEEADPLLPLIHDAEVETAARAAYGQDYRAFGFDDWGRGQGR